MERERTKNNRFVGPSEVVHNVPIARETMRLRLRCPPIACAIVPGQFVMIRPSGRTDPLLARPYALYEVICDSTGEPECIDIVYLVLGNGTKSLRSLNAGASVDIWGPLGNTFPTGLPGGNDAHLMIVAGGIGQTPFISLCNQLLRRRVYGGQSGIEPMPRRITVAYGVRNREFFAGIEDFEETGAVVKLATDDGSLGHAGFVTSLVEQQLASEDPPTVLFGCGPEPMLARLAAIAKLGGVPCWVSLETKMACGYGVCFSCVCPVVEPGGWDYRRVCLEGPVFPAENLAWDAF